MLARRDTAIITAAMLAILAIAGGGYVFAHNGDSEFDTGSAEYSDGYNRAQELADPDQIGIKEAVSRCNFALTAQPSKLDTVASISFFPHYDYSQHQRQEWAHGCLDALRQLSTYKVPKQSWE